MDSWQLFLLRSYFRGIGRLAPRLGVRQAFKLCFAPIHGPGVSKTAQVLLDRAERLPVAVEGRRLRVYRWSDHTDRPARTVLLAHGWNSRASRLTVWVEPLLARGFDVVAADMPAHGDSEGKRTDGLDWANAIGAVAEAAGPLHGIVGHSAGAFASALAVAGGHLLGRPAVPVKRLVMMATVDNPLLHVARFASALRLSDTVYEGLLRATVAEYGHPMEAFSLSRIPKGWNQPTLLLHDPEDREVPFAESESVAAARPNATLVPIHGMGHHRIARHPRVISRTIDFLTGQGPDWSARTSGMEPTRSVDPGTVSVTSASDID